MNGMNLGNTSHKGTKFSLESAASSLYYPLLCSIVRQKEGSGLNPLSAFVPLCLGVIKSGVNSEARAFMRLSRRGVDKGGKMSYSVNRLDENGGGCA